MPKENIYDAHGPDIFAIAVCWGNGEKTIELGSAYMDKHSQANEHAPMGTFVSLKLDLAGTDRLISVLQRARRKTFTDPPSREVKAFADRLKTRLGVESATIVDEVLAEETDEQPPSAAL